MSTSKPPPSAGPDGEGAAGERCAFAHSQQSVALDRLTVERAWAVVPDAQVERLVAVGDLDVDVCARGVASCVRQRLLDDAVGGQIDTQGQAGDLALPDQADVRSGRLRLVDQVVELAESGLRCSVGLASGVLAKDSEQPAGLGECLPRRGGDRLEAVAGVRRRAPARSAVQPRSRWRSPTDDARRCRGALGRCARALPSPSARECSPPSPPGSASRAAIASPRLRSDSPTTSAARRKSSGAALASAVHGGHRIAPYAEHEERDEQRGGEEEAAADHELGEQEQHDAEARHGQCRVLRAQDRDGEEHGRRCGEQWPSPRQREWHECEDAQHDRPGRTERASIAFESGSPRRRRAA